MNESAPHVVTGAARGIDLYCADRLKTSSPPLLVDLNPQALEQSPTELEAARGSVNLLAGDLTDPEVREQLCSHVAASGGFRSRGHDAGGVGSQAPPERVPELNLAAFAH